MENNKKDRQKLIKDYEKLTGNKIISYITGDRKGFETRIASDVYSFLYEHLLQDPPKKGVDLFLYSLGGMTNAAWGIVNLIRQFTKKFNVIVPFKALSSATLICLGADNIYMSRNGQLSPVDPSVNTPYNPQMPQVMSPKNQPQRVGLLPISVEEVLGYYYLATKNFGIEKEENLTQIFQSLTEKVHPVALGSVYRAREQIRMLAEKLLLFHFDKDKEEERIENIIKKLTYELYSHDYFISRREAKDDLGLKIVEMSSEMEQLSWELFKGYASQMELNQPFNPETLLGNNMTAKGLFRRAFVESNSLTNIFVTEKEFRRIEMPPQPNMPFKKGIQETMIFEGWRYA